jgi:hypothetical protein
VLASGGRTLAPFPRARAGWPASWQTLVSVAYQASRGNAASPAVTERAAIAPHETRLGLALGGDRAALSRLTARTLAGALSQMRPWSTWLGS